MIERDVQKNIKKINPWNYLPLSIFSTRRPPRFEMSSFKASEGIGSTITPISRDIGASSDTRSRVGGFSQNMQSVHSPYLNYSRNRWCSMCNRNHTGSCAHGGQCYACGKTGHLRKEYPTLRENQGISRGIRRPAIGMASPAGPTNDFRLPVNPTRPVVTQALV